MRLKLNIQSFKKRVRRLAAAFALLGGAYAEAGEVLRSTTQLPEFPEPLAEIHSTQTENFSAESSVAFLGIADINLHNLTIRAKDRLPSDWLNHSLRVTVDHSSEPQIQICRMSACAPASVKEQGKHPQLPEGRVYSSGPFEFGLLAPKTICKQSDTCTLTIPSFAVDMLARGRSPQLPRLLSVARLKTRLLLIDSEQGQIFFDVSSFPNSGGLTQLGKIKSLQATHRGETRIKFAQGELHLDILSGQARLLANDARIWHGRASGQKTVWEQIEIAGSSASKNTCTGALLQSNDKHALYTTCVLQFPPHGAKAPAFVMPLTTRPEGAIADDRSPNIFRAWSVGSKQLVQTDIVINADATVSEQLKTSVRFFGNNSSELFMSDNALLRHTAYGYFKVTEAGESRTSMPYSANPSFFSGSGRSILLGSADAKKICRWKHMLTHKGDGVSWRESGHSFPCSGSFVTPSARFLTVTRVVAGRLEVISLPDE
ncbi:MAG: hypothetical protein RL189_2600 [Pseudomonadota bacterium]|jgi:hypothetical protein